jgi:hypothetical protein
MRVVRHVISPFGFNGGNPPINATAQVSLPFPIAGIRIGTESDVDMVDVYIEGLGGLTRRHRVSAQRPYTGRIEGGAITIASVRRSELLRGRIDVTHVPDEWTVGEGVGDGPRLVLELIAADLDEKNLHIESMPRAPAHFTLDVSAAGADILWGCPVQGRSRISIAIHSPDAARAYAIYAIDYFSNGNVAGSPGNGATPVASGTVGGSGDDTVQWTYEGVPYDEIIVEVAGVTTERILIALDAYDGDV